MIEQVNAYTVTCDQCARPAYIFAKGVVEVIEQLKDGGWRVEDRPHDGRAWRHVCPLCVDQGQPQRPEELLPEQYEALTSEEKADLMSRWKAYIDSFPVGQYPRREQITGENQRYADSGRAEGYGPPGVYL